MATSLKRKGTDDSLTVSPPPIRRRLSPSDVVHSETVASGKNSAQQLIETTNGERITLYSWNVNGVGPLLQKRLSFPSKSVYPLRTFLRDHDWPHMLCLQEVKISRNDRATQRRMELAANAGSQDAEPTYTTHFSLPRDRYNATGFGGKVYGVATLVRDDLCSGQITTSTPDWDLEGRVLFHEFRQPRLVVVNGYWVNGTSNPYRDPKTGMETGTRHEHKLRFHKQMLDHCQTLTSEQKHVLLLGDVNVARARIDGHPNLRESPVQHIHNRGDFNEKFFTDEDGLKGVDVFRYLHGEKRKYTYHGRGRPWGESCDRVDMIIASPSFVDAETIVSTDICDNPKDRGHSDHVPLWVEIDCARLKV